MSKYFTKIEVDNMVDRVYENASEIIEELLTYDHPAYRFEFPLFFEKWDYFRELDIDIMIHTSSDINSGVTFNAINIPGCMAFGRDKKEGLLNFFRAFFECEDFRHLNNMSKMNQISFKSKHWGLLSDYISYDKLISDLDIEGWRIGNCSHYNSILVHKETVRKLSFSIPNWPIIPGHLHNLIRHWINASDAPSKALW